MHLIPLLLFSIVFLPTIALASFPDVPTNHPNREAIEYVQAQKIVGGYPDGTYQPNKTINRAEFAKILEESIPDAELGIGVCPMERRISQPSPTCGASGSGFMFVCSKDDPSCRDTPTEHFAPPRTSISPKPRR